MHRQAQLTFVFLVETGFHHVGQAGVELLTLSDLPPLSSQNAGITDVTHHTWPSCLSLTITWVCPGNGIDRKWVLMGALKGFEAEFPLILEDPLGSRVLVPNLQACCSTGDLHVECFRL